MSLERVGFEKDGFANGAGGGATPFSCHKAAPRLSPLFVDWWCKRVVFQPHLLLEYLPALSHKF